MVGAGTVPLNVQASTNLPGDTSHFTTLDVSSNCLVPSASTVGANGWAPMPAVLAGKALIDFAITASISSAVMVWAVPADDAAAAAGAPLPAWMCSVAFM